MELKFFTMLAEICRAFPPEFEGILEVKCRRPQTFAVLQSLSALDTDNLEKASPRYTSAGYFFSHRFNDSGRDISKLQFDYPLFAAAHQPFTLDVQRNRLRHQYNLAVFDQLQPHGGIDSSQYCDGRTFEEQARDMQRIMRLVLEQMLEWRLAINTTARDVIFLGPGQDTPTGYRDVHTVDTLLVGNSIRIEYISNAYSDMLNGVFASVELDFSDCREVLTWNYPDPVTTMLNADCETC